MSQNVIFVAKCNKTCHKIQYGCQKLYWLSQNVVIVAEYNKNCHKIQYGCHKMWWLLKNAIIVAECNEVFLKCSMVVTKYNDCHKMQ